MRKYIVILVLIIGSLQLSAVSYQPMSFQSTSAYVSQRSASMVMSMQRPVATGSLSAISASNFSTLNGEGGACYSPSNASLMRKVKIDEPNTEAVGEGVWESPIGDIPFILLGLMACLYVILAKKRKKVQKNLVVS